MGFKIVSVGWQCAQFLAQTLGSIQVQDRDDWEAWITYDKSTDNGADLIREWCDGRDARWHFTLNDEQLFAVRNQYETLKLLAPEDDDIIVFLDLDGDRLAHPRVLQRLADYYADGTLLTYGSYEPIPPAEGCQPAKPFPAEIVAANGYRAYIRDGGLTSFNHLRTMKGRLFNAMPEHLFKWAGRDEWYTAGTDYNFMLNGLELAGGKYRCIEETLLLYNNANPLADYLSHPATTSGCVQDVLQRPPLSPL